MRPLSLSFVALLAWVTACSSSESRPRLSETGDGGQGGVAGGAAGSGHGGAPTQGGLPTSCREPAPTCGTPDFGECCGIAAIPGGSFVRGAHAAEKSVWSGPAPATVSPFGMDVYEITVGRFRRFVEAYPTSRPSPGSGAHAKHPDSGWRDSWPLPADQPSLRAALVGTCGETTTWTEAPAGNEHKPIICLTWYEMFAFCAWDGGRLPTEAEWEFAAVGGDEQRVYPWSSPPSSGVINEENAVFEPSFGGNSVDPGPVGLKAKGRSRWGQADLLGNAMEWTHDAYLGLIEPCVDCLRTTGSSTRVARGGGSASQGLYSEYRWEGLEFKNGARLSIGGRCVRQPPFE